MINAPHAHKARTPRRIATLVASVVALCLSIPAISLPATADPQEQEQLQVEQSRTQAQEAKPQATLSLLASTPVVSASSGYHIKVSVTNATEHPLDAGTLSVATNSYYTFISRTDFKDWAHGQSAIATSDELGRASVPQLPAHGTATVSVDANPDEPQLKAMQSWGPKPVNITYYSANDTLPGKYAANLHTFLTRSKDGLATNDTPPMQITVAMPLTDASWKADSKRIDSLLNSGNDADNSGIKTKSATSDLQKVKESHPKLQLITDPAYAKTLKLVPESDGIMQSCDFDITAYSAHDNAEDYNAVGVPTSTWSANTGLHQYRKALASTTASPTAFAWQGQGNWTMNALTEARKQGYTVAIAQHGLSDPDDATVHSSVYTVATPAGDTTLIAAQHDLTRLAQGKSSDKAATAEQSEAGRLSKLMAQSAFYQMEQPYAKRNLLICLSPSLSTQENNAILSALEQATWLSLTSLNTLVQSEPYLTGNDAIQALPRTSGLSAQQEQKLNQTMDSLKSSATDIARFRTAVLDTTAPSSATDSNNHSQDSQNKQNGNSSNSRTSGNKQPNNDDSQSLARQDAKDTASRPKSGDTWMDSVTALHSEIAFHALGARNGQHFADDAETLADRLFQGIHINQTEPLTVVSETAKMPVTVSNALPYPVTIKVSSLTNSMEIATSRFEDITVPAKGDAQTTFTVRVSTSGSATAQMNLVDRSGNTFSSPQSTPITSTLRISDITGWLLIGFALLLGIVGLWRQFNRKKDPDQ